MSSERSAGEPQSQTRKAYATTFYDAFKKVSKMHPEVFATYCEPR